MIHHHALPCQMSQANKRITKHPQHCQLFLAGAWEPLLSAFRTALACDTGLWVSLASQRIRCGKAFLPGGFPSFPLLLIFSPKESMSGSISSSFP